MIESYSRKQIADDLNQIFSDEMYLTPSEGDDAKVPLYEHLLDEPGFALTVHHRVQQLLSEKLGQRIQIPIGTITADFLSGIVHTSDGVSLRKRKANESIEDVHHMIGKFDKANEPKKNFEETSVREKYEQGRQLRWSDTAPGSFERLCDVIEGKFLELKEKIEAAPVKAPSESTSGEAVHA